MTEQADRATGQAVLGKELPQVFLDYLADNEISPLIYSTSTAHNRYICICPTWQATEEDLLADFSSGVELAHESPRFYRLTRPYPSNAISSSALYRQGKIIGMDLASGMAVDALRLCPGDNVLDLCCAPGTKLTLAALLAGPTGSVTGVDISRHRLGTARSLVKKYRPPRVRLFLADGRAFDRRVFLPCREGSQTEPVRGTIDALANHGRRAFTLRQNIDASKAATTQSPFTTRFLSMRSAPMTAPSSMSSRYSPFL